MISVLVLVLSALLVPAHANSQSGNGPTSLEFPPWFRFGASTAAYQVEGAWNVSDKGESAWDRFVHEDPSRVSDLSNGDVACDSYHLWKRDVEMAKELGLQHYRFSISWTRLLPTGYSNVISEDGKRYYNNVIDALIENGIEPLVTLFHFDLPQNLQAMGGWTNPLITDFFASYAKVAFALFGDRVKLWLTINEPQILCDLAYSTGNMVPGYIDEKISLHLCVKHVLLGHAKAYRVYEKYFKSLQKGKISLSNNFQWLSPGPRKYKTLRKLALDYVIGRYTHPIYSSQGGYPPSVVKIMKNASLKENYPTSRLAEFTAEEVKLIKGTYDYLAVNYYGCRTVRRAYAGETIPIFLFNGLPELNAIIEIDPATNSGEGDNPAIICPKGLRQLLYWIKRTYGDTIEVVITENGLLTQGVNLQDDMRVSYIRGHLEQLLLSIHVDKVNVTAYTHWALMDNFEWASGYQPKYGLYHVDFESPDRTRTPRASAAFYSNVIKSRSLNMRTSDQPVDYEVNEDDNNDKEN